MALGDAIQKRMEELSKRQAAFDARLAAVAEGATLRAVEEAQDNTPPNTFEEDELRGVHMISLICGICLQFLQNFLPTFLLIH